MPFGISSSVLTSPGLPEFTNLFRKMPQYGFLCAELGYSPAFDPEFMLEVRNAAHANGIEIISVHSPEKAWSLNLPHNRQEATALVKRSVEAAVFWGAKSVVIHANTCAAIADESEYADSLNHSREAIRECAIFALQHDVLLAVENMPILHPPHCPSHQAEDLLYFLDGSPKNLRICYDTGHANINRHSVAHELKLLAPWLYSIHLHNNDRSYDHHCLPSDGVFDWSVFFGELSTHQLNPICIFEINNVLPLDFVLQDLQRFAGFCNIKTFPAPICANSPDANNV